MITVHNSLTGKKETIEPIEPGHVRMYVCGMTVYDLCHIGHARAMVVFDVVARYLRWRGYRVTYARNITDIDDKIIRRAAENGEPIEVLTERYIGAMYEDFDALGIQRPDLEPRATAHIAQIVAMIGRLIERGHAYVAMNGDVYYRVASFPAYGRLSGKRPADLRAGARIEIGEAKEDPLDFALWKAAKRGEPAWDSPWGPGRPGWHIECSAMSTAELGERFDIHGGGMDLKFPHHENEIAQSCGASDAGFAKLWMHNGFVNVEEEKMSKSLGNFFTIRDVLATHRPEAVRYFVLSSHYRSPLNYSEDNLARARAALDGLYTALRGVAPADSPDPGAIARFAAAMDDDFNTALALAELKAVAGELNRARDAGDVERAGGLAAALREAGAVLGIACEAPDAWFQAADAGGAERGEALETDRIEALITQRNAARRDRDWATADRIRDELESAGVVLEDGPAGTTWKRG